MSGAQPPAVAVRLGPRQIAMAHDLAWTVRDKAALERRFQLLFAGSPRRDWAVQYLVERFIEDVTLYPREWPVSAEPPSNAEWRFDGISHNTGC